jgi:hypothetical protein
LRQAADRAFPSTIRDPDNSFWRFLRDLPYGDRRVVGPQCHAWLLSSLNVPLLFDSFSGGPKCQAHQIRILDEVGPAEQRNAFYQRVVATTVEDCSRFHYFCNTSPYP